MTDLAHATDDELAAALADLGDNLAVPRVDLVGGVRAGLTAHEPVEHRPPLAAAAAVFLLVAIGAVLAIAPARSAVADWLGIGRTGVEIDETPPPAPEPDLPEPAGEGAVEPSDVRANATVDFPVKLLDTDLAGPITAWEVRSTAGVTELVVVHDDLVLSGRQARFPSPLAVKIVPEDGAVIEATSPDGVAALWIEGDHVRQIEGVAEQSTSALLWVADGVEWRLEGATGVDAALTLADSLG